MHRKLVLLALAALVLAAPTFAAEFANAKAELFAAVAAEKKKNWNAALLHYENIYDSAPTDLQTRMELRKKFDELHPKVKHNTDPAKAGVWKVRVYVFRTLDLSLKDKDGKDYKIVNTFSEDEIKALGVATQAFADEVWNHTWGSLRIQWDMVVIDQPLTQAPGWPDPANCTPYFTDLKPGEVDTLMVYAKTKGSGGTIQMSLWAGTFGILPETKGATYIGFNAGDGLSEDPSGEVQLHEWLHAAHWTMEDRQGYPPGVMVTSDCGGKCSGIPDVPCFVRKEGDPAGWMPLYIHILEDHATRKMWRELSATHPIRTVWSDADLFCREFLVLGPFSTEGKPNYGLDSPYIDESFDRAPTSGSESGGLKWERIATRERILDLTPKYGEKANRVCYLAVVVRSPKARAAQVRIGSDDGCKLWQDGDLILTAPEPRGVGPDQNVIDTRLRKGDNLFVAKVYDSGGGWCFVFRVTDAKGNFLPDIKYVAPTTR